MCHGWKICILVTHRPQSDRCRRGEAEVCILNFKTTWSKFQKPCQTAVMRGEAELHTYNLKKISLPQSRSEAVVCVSTPRMYPRSGYFLVKYIFNFQVKWKKVMTSAGNFSDFLLWNMLYQDLLLPQIQYLGTVWAQFRQILWPSLFCSYLPP